MQEKIKASVHGKAVPEDRSVTLSIRSGLTVLNGSWQWDMHSEAVYGSDVMAFPDHFEGTKGIIHPDDLGRVAAALDLLPDMHIARLDFRLITTYGEIKNIVGQEISLANTALDDTPAASVPLPWEAAALKTASRKEAAWLRLRDTLTDASEKLHGTGAWYINKVTGEAWYSDAVFRMHGIPPQSLNAHGHTFNAFIHNDDKTTVQEAVERAYAAEVPLHLEYRIVQPDGNIRYLRLVTQWWFSEDGHLMFGGLLQDLTEQREQSAQLTVAEANVWILQQVAQFAEKQASVGYWFMNLATRKTTFSPNYLRIHGVKPPFVPAHNLFLKLVHPDDKAQVSGLLERIYTNHVLPETEYRIIRPDGRVRYLQLSGKLAAQPGSPLMMMGVVQDITTRRLLEQNVQELGEAIALHNATADAIEQVADVATVTWFANGDMRWSDGFYRMLGYKPDSIEPVLRIWQKSIHPEYLKSFNDTIALALNQQAVEPLVFRMLAKGGMRPLRLSFRLVTLEGKNVLIGVLENVTEQTALQQRVKERERYARLLEDVSPEALFLTNAENTVLSWNAGAEQKTGIKKDDALHKNLFDLFPNLQTEAFTYELHTALAGKEVHVQKARGAYLSRTHSYFLIPFKDEQNAPAGVLHVVQDISKELELQQQLSERLYFIENLLDAAVDRIVVLDHQMNYLYWNPKAEKYYALSKQRVLGKNILEIFPAFRNDPSYQEFRRALKGETVHLPASTADEHGAYFETYLIPVRNDDGVVNAVLWIVHDLSKEFELQQERQNSLVLLQEEHRRMADAQAIGHIGSFEWNVGDKTVSWSDELYRIMGWEPQSLEVTVELTEAMVHPDDQAAVMELKEQSFSQPGFYQTEHRIVRPDGQTIYVAHRFESIADATGAILRVHGTVQDITAFVAARKEQEAMERLLHSAEEVAHTGSYEADLRTGRFRFSEGMYRLFGETPYSFEPSLEFIDARSHPDDVAAATAALNRAAANKEPYAYTRRIQHKDGTWRILEAQGKVACDAAGNAVKFIGLVQDVTERKKAEEQILRLKDEVAQQATDKYLTLFNSIDEGFYQCEVIFDEAGKAIDIRYLEENPAAVRIVGKSFVGKTLKEINPAYEAYWFEIFGEVALAGKSKRMERYSAPDDKWFDFYVAKVGGESSRQVMVVFQDITDRKKTERALLEVNARLVDVLESTTDAFYSVDAAFNFSYVNRKAAQLWQRNQESLIGKHYWTEFPDAVGSESYHKHYEVLQSGKPVQFQTISPLVGSWVEVSIYPGEWGGLSVFFRDISEQKEAEENLRNFAATLEQQVAERTKELQKNVAILQQSEEVAQIGSWEYEIATGKFNWSEGMYHLMGKPIGETVQPETYLEQATEGCQAVASNIVCYLKNEHQPFEETLHMLVNGVEKIIRIKGAVIMDEGGKPLKMIGVDSDITGIRHAEARLKESQNLLEQTVVATPDAIIVFDVARQTMTYLNKIMSQWTGFSNEKLEAMGAEGLLEMVHPDDRINLIQFNNELLTSKNEEVRLSDYRMQSGGREFWVRNRSLVLKRSKNGSPTHFLIILQDITEAYVVQEKLKALNTSLVQKNKELEARNEEITSFTFIASHDLKEPIRKIQTFTDLLLHIEGKNLSESSHGLLARMTSSVKRLSFLLDDILELSQIHAETGNFEQVDLNDTMQKVIIELEAEIASTGATINYDPLPRINGIENQVFYLFKNLLSNAIKFQPNGNKPEVTISAQEVQEVESSGQVLSGNYLRVTVKDNGIGFDEAYKEKVFRIFQRLHVKEAFGGTGMGLAICRKVMENHRGFIDVKSKVGKGATFCCYFPVPEAGL